MGQEKSLPDRCNSVQTTYRTVSSRISRPPSRAPSSTKSYASSAYSTGTTATASTSTSSSSAKTSGSTESKQTKYLKKQLYIKSYLDIVEQDRAARNNFPAAKPGIRNYTPKILVEKEQQQQSQQQQQQQHDPKEVDVWI